MTSLKEDMQKSLQSHFLVKLLSATGEVHPKPKLNMFCGLSQNFYIFWKIIMIILKQIIWETQKMALKFEWTQQFLS